MPEWNTTERGKMREDEDDDHPTGLDGWSDMDLVGIPFGPAREHEDHGWPDEEDQSNGS